MRLVRFFSRRDLRPLAGALVFAFSAGCTACASADTLPDAVRSALLRHPEVLAAAAAVRAARAIHDQAAAGRYPTIDARAALGREQTDSAALRNAGIDSRSLSREEANLVLRQNLYDGSQVRSQMERESNRVESARSRLRETGEIIALRAAEAYLDVLRDQQLVELAEQNVRSHLELLEKTELRFRSGVGQRADVEQSAARLALARSTLVTARANAADSAARYRRLVGREPGRLSLPPGAGHAVPASLEYARALAAQKSEAVRSARFELSGAQAAVRAIRADRLPRLDLELSASRVRDVDGIPGPHHDNQAMLVMRYNLFRGGADEARIREAVERETIAMEALHNALMSTEETVMRAWAALQAARERLASLAKHVEASSRVLEAYRSQFELGRRSLLDLLNAENELFQARAALTSGRSAERAAEFRMLTAVSSLVAALGLSPEMDRLDPGPAAERTDSEAASTAAR